jgi:hypothetical protein
MFWEFTIKPLVMKAIYKPYFILHIQNNIDPKYPSQTKTVKCFILFFTLPFQVELYFCSLKKTHYANGFLYGID